MIIELGHFFFILTCILALVQMGFATGYFYRPSIDAYAQICRKICALMFIFCNLAFLALIYSYIVSDFSVMMVFKNSHSMKPLFYKIAASWGNHEGSLLLWIWVLCSYGYFFARSQKNSNRFNITALGIHGFLIACFTLFTLLTSNPFGRLLQMASEGMGLNPLLQDPGLVAHPPFLYLGYVGYGLVYSLVIAGLLTGQLDDVWAKITRKWAGLAWMFLTIGIALGSIWAYYELGWGGYWFWDPVENASLLPWITGTALLHALTMQRTGQYMKHWTVLLSLTCFSLSLIGTFLVRSGVLTSVHAFAVDPSRGIFILGLIALITGGGLTLYGLKAETIQSRKLSLNFLSRENGLLIHNFLMVIITATVFIGTFYPIILNALEAGQVSVGAPYYNKTVGPLCFLLAIFMAVLPAMKWKKDKLQNALRILILPTIFSVICGVVLISKFGVTDMLSILATVMGGFVICALAMDIVFRLTKKGVKSILNQAFILMFLGHFGFAFMLGSIGIHSLYSSEHIQYMQKGEMIQMGNISATFHGIEKDLGPNYNIDRAMFEIKDKNGQFIQDMEPEKRWYPVARQSTSEIALKPSMMHNIYLVLGERNPANAEQWAVRGYYHVMIFGIWFGALLMALSGLLFIFLRNADHGVEVKDAKK